MKRLIGVVFMLVLFATNMVSAFEVQKLYLEGVNQIEGNVLSGMDTPREWDLSLVFKADVVDVPVIGTLGARVDASYTPDNSFDSVGLATEIYINPLGLKYIELGARHNEQNVSDLNFNDGYSAFFRFGIGL